MDHHTNQAEWDTRQLYFQTLGEAQRFCFEARVGKNAEIWFSVLDAIMSQYGPALRDRKLCEEIWRELEAVNNSLHPTHDDHLTNTERTSMAIDSLRRIEPKVMGLLYSSGLLSPRRIGTGAAAAEGLG